MDQETIDLLRRTVSEATVFIGMSLNTLPVDKQDIMKSFLISFLKTTRQLCKDVVVLEGEENEVLKDLFKQLQGKVNWDLE